MRSHSFSTFLKVILLFAVTIVLLLLILFFSRKLQAHSNHLGQLRLFYEELKTYQPSARNQYFSHRFVPLLERTLMADSVSANWLNKFKQYPLQYPANVLLYVNDHINKHTAKTFATPKFTGGHLQVKLIHLSSNPVVFTLFFQQSGNSLRADSVAGLEKYFWHLSCLEEQQQLDSLLYLKHN